MKRSIALLAASAVALAPAAAQAKPSPRAKVFRATFKAVGADGSYATAKFGKAQLVDGKKRDKLTLHLRRLAPRTVYQFAVLQAPAGADACAAGAPAGTPAGTWTTRKPLRTNARGNLAAKATAKDFRSERRAVYYVTVSGADGQALACGALKRKHAKHKGDKGGDKGGKQDGRGGKGPKH